MNKCYLLAFFVLTCGCMPSARMHIASLEGESKYKGGKVVSIDLSRGKYIPMLDDPAGGGVSPEPYLLPWSAPTKIDDNTFATVPLDQNLRKLNLAGCHIGSETVRRIHSECGILTSLNLSDTQITSDDVELIKGFRQLEELSLAGTRVDDRCIEDLTQLRKLEELNIVDTNFNAASIERLLELPRLKKIFIFHTPAAQEDSKTSKEVLSDPRVISENPFGGFLI